MWPTTTSPTLEHMQDMGFPSTKWWGWVMIDCCSSTRAKTPAMYADDSNDPLCGGVVIDISRFHKEYQGSELPLHPYFNGRLIQHESTNDILVIMLVDNRRQRAWLLPLTSQVVFDKYGYDYNGAKEVHLEELHIIEVSTAVREAALAAKINDFSKTLDEDGGSAVDKLRVAARLYSLTWPNTPYLHKAKSHFQNFFIRTVS